MLWRRELRESRAIRERMMHERYLLCCRAWAEAIEAHDHEAAAEAARLAEMYHRLRGPHALG
jgi:cyclopropane fatty-acyl-phospholipid synthase-like methyltransferase